MTGAAVLDALGPARETIRGRLQPDFPLAEITWFRVGGPADLLFQPADEADLAAFLAALPEEIPVTVIGLGSNLLVRDGGIAGVVIRLSAKGFGAVEIDGNRVRAGAAVPDKRLAEKAAEAGLAGFSFFYGIPGAVGGALRMNAGAHGGETRDVVRMISAVDRSGERHTLTADEMGFSYRHSGAAKDLIFTGAVFVGTPADPNAIRAEMDAVTAHREAAQPIRERTGGSTFKNPDGAKAWQLIDAAGCRGLTIGGAQVSEKHCNFLINTGEATAGDLETLGETVRARVLETAGVRLEWEIKRLGRWPDGIEIAEFLGRTA